LNSIVTAIVSIDVSHVFENTYIVAAIILMVFLWMFKVDRSIASIYAHVTGIVSWTHEINERTIENSNEIENIKASAARKES
jgi:hypothetical protein